MCPASEADCVMLPIIQDLSTRVHGLEKSQVAEGEKTRAGLSGLSTKIDRVDKKLDRVIEGLEIGQVVPVRTSIPSHPTRDEHVAGNGKDRPLLSWSADEDTGMHTAPVWAGRAKEGASILEVTDRERQRLAIENASLKASMAEREKLVCVAREDRNRSNELTLKKWQIATGLVTTVLGSGVITLIVSYLLAR